MSQSDPIVKLPNRLETMGLIGVLNPFVRFVSASRLAMLNKHIEQTPPVLNPELPRILGGSEKELAKYTFGVRMPADGTIVSTHRRYPFGTSNRDLGGPLISIIYQNDETGEHDFLEVNHIDHRHKTFNYPYHINDMVYRLRPGDTLRAGTPLSSSPNILEGGAYATGVDAEVAYMSIPGANEDGYVVSRSFTERAGLTETGESNASWGNHCYLLNLYGDINNYKPFPDIGDTIRPDGLVFAIRDYDPLYDHVELSPASLMDVDHLSDRCEYGVPGAIVYDVDVETGLNRRGKGDKGKTKAVIPSGMGIQEDRYVEANSLYYRSILDAYDRIKRENRRGVTLSPKLHSEIVRAIGDNPNDPTIRRGAATPHVRRTRKKNFLDVYEIKVRWRTNKILQRGDKITNRVGGKGVITQIREDHEMPTNANGVRADIAIYAKGAVSRLNPGQFYEQFINAASRDMSNAIRDINQSSGYETAWVELMRYYEVAAPTQHAVLDKEYTTADMRKGHVEEVCRNGIYLFIRADDPHVDPGIVGRIRSVIEPTYGPVTYVDDAGNIRTTHDSVLIGSEHILVLEKSDQRPMAASSATLQHHGLISGPTRQTRSAHPGKRQATKTAGETEVRLFAAAMGPDAAAELLDLSNNPRAHRAACQSILEAEHPAQVVQLVDRKEVPYGESRALAFITNLLAARGEEIVQRERK